MKLIFIIFFLDFRTVCLDVPNGRKRAPVLTYDCHGQGGNQRWSIKSANLDNKNPVRLIHSSGLCLQADGMRKVVVMETCDDSASDQQWNWRQLHLENGTIGPL